MMVEPEGKNLGVSKTGTQGFFVKKIQEGNIERIQIKITESLEQAKQIQQVNDKDIKRLTEEIAKKFDMLSKYLQIDIDEQLEIPVAKIIDRETKQVIRQIPPDYLLDLMKKVDQMLAVLVEKEA